MIDWQGRVDIIANALMDEVKQLRAVNELLYAALQNVEFVDDYEFGEQCPICFGNRNSKHNLDCQLKQALDAARPWAAKTEIGA